MTTFEIVTLVASLIATVFSSMLGLIVWLIKHSANVQLELLGKNIEEAKADAKRASDLLTKEIELRHQQDIKMTCHDGKFLAMDSDVRRLEVRDDGQQEQLFVLKERLDRGARTRSDQSPAGRLPREEPESVPPSRPAGLPPMRPRLPSRRGE